jgi:hypothetical protein
MTRWRAAGIHFSASVIIACILFSIAYFIWYPTPYFEAAGAKFLWAVLVGVDVVLGPVLTLIVFKAGKPGMKFDMSFIVVAQAIALLYGFSVIADARPAYVVFAVDRFNVVPANWVMAESQAVAPAEFQKMSWGGPELVAAQRPEEKEKSERLMFSALLGYDIETQPEFFVPYGQAKEEIIAAGKPLDELFDRYPEQKAELTELLVAAHGSSEGLLYLPMTATRRDMAAIIDAETSAVITALPVDPW